MSDWPSEKVMLRSTAGSGDNSHAIGGVINTPSIMMGLFCSVSIVLFENICNHGIARVCIPGFEVLSR